MVDQSSTRRSQVCAFDRSSAHMADDLRDLAPERDFPDVSCGDIVDCRTPIRVPLELDDDIRSI